MTVQRVDALEAGIRFMTWVFSEGQAFADDVREYTTRIGMNWREVKESIHKEDGTLCLIKEIEQVSSSMGSQIFAWFEVGRNSIFLSNMTGTGTPSELVDAAMLGYRRYLEEVQIRIEVRDRLQELLRSMSNGSLQDKANALGQLRERLREQALIQDEQEQKMKSRKPVVTNIHISNVSNSVLTVMSQLDHVSQSIQTAPALSSAKREELTKLVLDLKNAIGTIPESHADEAEVVGEQANNLSEELKKPQPRQASLKVTAAGLVEATKALATVVPSAIETAKAIAAFVANPLS